MGVIEMTHRLKMRKQFILDPKKIRIVKKIMNARTDTEAIERATDAVVVDSKIRNVLMTIKGKGSIKDIYGRCKD
jgi:hypothetical protein